MPDRTSPLHRPFALVAVLAWTGCGGGDAPAPASETPDAPVEAQAPATAETAAATPSFNCAAAETEVENLICADAELASLDRQLAEVFASAVSVAEGFGNAEPALAEMRALQRGWISGRDECWRSDDVRACTYDEYRRRIAVLQAEYRLVDPTSTVFWTCEENPANEFVTTHFPTDPATAVIERGDDSQVGVAVPTASGVRYEASFGAWFWTQGDEAQAEWPQGTSLSCVVRERR